jgi:ABC-type polysaccharide/polyol phosphate export permease
MNYSTVSGGIGNLLEYRRLLSTLIARDLRVKYRDTIIGFWWMLLQPLLMLSTYAIVFGFLGRDGRIKGQQEISCCCCFAA